MKLRGVSVGGGSSDGKMHVTRWRRAGLAIGLIGLVVYSLGFSSAHWGGHDVDTVTNGTVTYTVEKYLGLWRKCETVTEGSDVIKEECVPEDDTNGCIVVAKVLCTSGLITMVTAYVTSWIASHRGNMKVVTVAGIGLVVGSVIAFAGSTLFTGKIRADDPTLDAEYSVFLALFGCLGTIFSGGISIYFSNNDYHNIP